MTDAFLEQLTVLVLKHGQSTSLAELLQHLKGHKVSSMSSAADIESGNNPGSPVLDEVTF